MNEWVNVREGSSESEFESLIVRDPEPEALRSADKLSVVDAESLKESDTVVVPLRLGRDLLSVIV